MTTTLEPWQIKRSPAPWRSDAGEIYADNDSVVAFMRLYDDDGNTAKFNVADAQTLAAAPDLLAACKALVALIEKDYGGYDAIEEWQQAIKAINQAETYT